MTESKDNQSNILIKEKSTEKGNREQETNRYNGEAHRKALQIPTIGRRKSRRRINANSRVMVLGSWLNYALKPSNPSLTFQRDDLSHAPEWVQSTARDKTLLLTTKHIKKVIAKLSKMKLAYQRLIDSC